tara:strand:- start:101416 stop:102372 length:957 start_codon:yes stop_codon:yes gene_type:complete
MNTHTISIIALASGLTISLAAVGCTQKVKRADQETDQKAGNTHQTSIDERPAIENIHVLSPDLISGGQPDGAIAYDELADMGIRTVIGVDATPPDKAQADLRGMRVIHIPIGYDGINEERAEQLAHAIRTAERPIYVHCHHGKHRGPAALCVGAIMSGDLSTADALEHLKISGTSPNYPGLWRGVDLAKPMSAAEFAKPVELPEEADPGDFAQAMAQIDQLNELLWLCAENDFQTPEHHPDLVPTAIAGQIHNLLRVLAVDQRVDEEGLWFKEAMDESVTLAGQIETYIDDGEIALANEALIAMNESCVTCHDGSRNE